VVFCGCTFKSKKGSFFKWGKGQWRKSNKISFLNSNTNIWKDADKEIHNPRRGCLVKKYKERKRERQKERKLESEKDKKRERGKEGKREREKEVEMSILKSVKHFDAKSIEIPTREKKFSEFHFEVETYFWGFRVTRLEIGRKLTNNSCIKRFFVSAFWRIWAVGKVFLSTYHLTVLKFLRQMAQR